MRDLSTMAVRKTVFTVLPHVWLGRTADVAVDTNADTVTN
jgi:hypothetical protein